MAEESAFMASINKFIKSKEDKGSLLSFARDLSPENKSSLGKQLETFADDMRKLEKGQMSYAEMRELYG